METRKVTELKQKKMKEDQYKVRHAEKEKKRRIKPF